RDDLVTGVQTCALPIFKLNLPTVPIHDLNIHNDDVIVATHGRSFWVLDDITPLRQIDANSANAEMILYKPQAGLRLHLPDAIERSEEHTSELQSPDHLV